MNKVILTEHFANANGHINQKQLFNYLHGNLKTNKAKSELKPCAQSPALCLASNDWDTTLSAVNAALTKMKNEFSSLYYFTTIQMSGGLRVSETLNIKVYDITPTGLIKIKTLKGGKSKIINVSEVRDFLLHCKQSAYLPWQDWNRFYVYREFKKFGLPEIQTGARRHAVTHLFRHLQTAELRSINANEKETAEFLGHKSLRSQESYGR